MNAIFGFIPHCWKHILMGQKCLLGAAPGWEIFTYPWLPFVSQVSSSTITRGGETWSTEHHLLGGKEIHLQIDLFAPKE